jgi:hypothetical protein
MKTYLISAAGVIFFSIVVSLLIPDGKLNKTITFVLRLACILVLIQPVTTLFNVNESENAGIVDYDFVCTVYSEELSKNLNNTVLEKFNVECESIVAVSYENEFNVESVSLSVNDTDEKLIDEIVEYLKGLGYINITVYAKSN